ncbi:hypothetical protein BpHYR1_041617 [Brachionus plicatilis]|uniref:Uncharacterized protein n=1 Tax=Brachionus plicatilis TaxID=10195 RepID=A0A3M7RH61_BRAPC|nr:hypothetical protein BpHYR1_041617 [Brachionus plicatilis]
MPLNFWWLSTKISSNSKVIGVTKGMSLWLGIRLLVLGRRPKILTAKLAGQIIDGRGLHNHYLDN